MFGEQMEAPNCKSCIDLAAQLAQVTAERDRLRDDIRKAFHKTAVLTANELADWVQWLIPYVYQLQQLLAEAQATITEQKAILEERRNGL